MFEYWLKFNESKAEIIIIGYKHNLSKIPKTNFISGNENIYSINCANF